MTRRLLLLAALLVALAPATPGRAADAIPIEPEAREAAKEMWQEQFRAARQRVAQARGRHAEAVEAYKRMRHRNRNRGEEREKILIERSAAETELAAAEGELKALFERARRAGVPPGWMRLDRSDLPASPDPDGAAAAADGPASP